MQLPPKPEGGVKQIRCPHCGTPFHVVIASNHWPSEAERGVNSHFKKCAAMSEEDRAYYYKNRVWPRVRVGKR